MVSIHVVRSVFAVTMTAVLLAGCTSTGQITELETTHYTERLETRTDGGMRISTSQPVWTEVKNNSTHTLWLLRAGTDPSYFSSLEIAWPLHARFDKKGNAEIDTYFESLSFTDPIPPGVTRSGILFTNPHKGTHVLNVDLLGQQTFFPFTLSRNLLVQDLLFSGGLAQLGFVRGVGAVAEEPVENTNSEHHSHTDGLRAVLFFVTRPLSLSEIESLDWEPLLQQRATEAATKKCNQTNRGVNLA